MDKVASIGERVKKYVNILKLSTGIVSGHLLCRKKSMFKVVIMTPEGLHLCPCAVFIVELCELLTLYMNLLAVWY